MLSFRKNRHALRAVGCSDHSVSASLQGALHTVAHGGFVIHEQNQFTAAAREGTGRPRRRLADSLWRSRQVKFKYGAFINLALHADESPMPSNNPAHCRQTKPGALANFLGCKKRVKNAIENFRWNSCSGVFD